MTEKDLEKLEKLAMMKDDSDLAFMDEVEKTNEHLSEIHEVQNQSLDVLKKIEQKEIITQEIKIPEIPKFSTSISISNLPKIQKVEVINQPPPIVNVNVPDVILPEFPQFPPIPETKISILTKELEDGLITIADVLREIRGITEKNGMKEMVLTNHGYSAVNLKNNAGAQINPATEEKQDTLIANTNVGTVSTANSTQTPLGIGGVFTGTAEDIADYVTVNVVVKSDVASATDGFSVQFSPDGTNWDVPPETHTISAGVGLAHLTRSKARYFRVVYTNGGTAQTYFRLYTVFKREAVSLSFEQLDSAINDQHDAAIVRAILNAKNPAGVYGNINRTTGGNLKMSLEEIDPTATLPAGTNAIGKVGHDITGIGHGVTTVTVAGTDVVLASSTACKRVVIQAMNNNTGIIAVGASGVDGTLNTGTGIILYAGDAFEFEIDNLADIFIDATVSGEKARYTYFT